MSPILEKNRYDDDAGKKAMTDALTKGLSHLGLSADVFLGLFEDNKYVAKVAAQFKEGDRPAQIMHGESQRDPEDEGGVPEEDRHLLTKEHGEKSQYEVNKHKEALRFTNETLDLFKSMTGASDVNVWMATAISPGGKSTNGHKVDRLKEAFPELGAKIEKAANEVRSRTGARLQ